MTIRFYCTLIALTLTLSLWAAPTHLSGFFIGQLSNGDYIKVYLQANDKTLEGYWGKDTEKNISYVPGAQALKGEIKAGNLVVLKQAQLGDVVFEGFYDEIKHRLRGDWMLSKMGQAIDLAPLAIQLNKQLSISSEHSEETDEELRKTTTINQPKLKSVKALTAGEKAFTDYISNRLFKIKNEFTRDVLISESKDNTFFFGNSMLNIDHEVTYAHYPYISIRFNISTYYAGAIHPIHSTVTINYDLKQGKPIVLNTLFKEYSHYLGFISKLAEEQLNQNLQDIVGDDPKAVRFWIKNGTKAIVENYQNWNFTPLGLLISFEPYQVAPYAFGRQEIIIPYSLLTDAFQDNIQTFFK